MKRQNTAKEYKGNLVDRNRYGRDFEAELPVLLKECFKVFCRTT